MSVIDDMVRMLDRLPREPFPVRIEHASPDFIDDIKARCNVVDKTLSGGSQIHGLPLVFNPKLPLGLVRVVMSDGACLDQRVPLFANQLRRE